MSPSRYSALLMQSSGKPFVTIIFIFIKSFQVILSSSLHLLYTSPSCPLSLFTKGDCLGQLCGWFRFCPIDYISHLFPSFRISRRRVNLMGCLVESQMFMLPWICGVQVIIKVFLCCFISAPLFFLIKRFRNWKGSLIIMF